MFQNTPERRAYTSNVGPQSAHLLWRRRTVTNYGGAVIGRDGTVYVGTLEGTFLAINPDGTLKWSVSTVPYTIESTPAILLDGRVGVVDAHGTLRVFNPDGSSSWEFPTAQCPCVETSPVVGYDGTIYFASNDTLYALNPEGTLLWTYESTTQITGPPAVRADGIVYFPSGELYALNPDGTLLWKTGSFSPRESPAIAPDGTIYANTGFPTVLRAIRPNGTLKWKYQSKNAVSSDVPCSPAVGPDGTIYVYVPHDNGEGNSDGYVLALNADGTVRWRAHYGSFATAISVGGDGTLYFGSSTAPINALAAVFALSPDGSLKWEYDDGLPGDSSKTPVAIGSGRVYAGGHHAFFAIGL